MNDPKDDDDADPRLLPTLLQRVEAQREAMARALHGELGGLLSALKLDLARLRRPPGGLSDEMATRLAQAEARLDEAVALERRLVEQLRPSVLQHLGLAEALTALADGLRGGRGLAVHETVEAVTLAPDRALALYRVAEDGLAWLVETGGSAALTLTLAAVDGHVELVLAQQTPLDEPRRSAWADQVTAALLRAYARRAGGPLQLDAGPAADGASAATRLCLTVPAKRDGGPAPTPAA